MSRLYRLDRVGTRNNFASKRGLMGSSRGKGGIRKRGKRRVKKGKL